MNGEEQGTFRAVELFCVMLYWGICNITHFSKPIKLDSTKNELYVHEYLKIIKRLWNLKKT